MSNEQNPGGDATGFMQSLRVNADNSLLRSENIGALIRQFLAALFRVVEDSSEGRISRELGIASVQANCNYYAGMLTGRIPCRFSIDGDWYPMRLAQHLRREIDATGEAEAVIASAFASMANRAFEILKIQDEDASERAVDDLVQSYVGLFGGIK